VSVALQVSRVQRERLALEVKMVLILIFLDLVDQEVFPVKPEIRVKKESPEVLFTKVTVVNEVKKVKKVDVVREVLMDLRVTRAIRVIKVIRVRRVTKVRKADVVRLV